MTRRATDDEGAKPQPGGWAICPVCLGTGTFRSSEGRRPAPCRRCEGEGLFLAERQAGYNDNHEPLAP